MDTVLPLFGETQSSALGALGLNLQSFLFQLITFVLLLLILRRYAFPPLVRTLEERRKAVEQSIDQAKETALAMQTAEKQIEQMLREARDQAAELVTAGHREATKKVEEAEAHAAKRAEQIVKDAHTSMQHELISAREALKHETARLVAEATSAIIKEKIDARKNAGLINKTLQAVAVKDGE